MLYRVVTLAGLVIVVLASLVLMRGTQLAKVEARQTLTTFLDRKKTVQYLLTERVDEPPETETGEQRARRENSFRNALHELREQGIIGIDGERVADLSQRYRWACSECSDVSRPCSGTPGAHGDELSVRVPGGYISPGPEHVPSAFQPRTFPVPYCNPALLVWSSQTLLHLFW